MLNSPRRVQNTIAMRPVRCDILDCMEMELCVAFKLNDPTRLA
ncbi:hypothetical protein L798_13524 [Zootermopsis nevadensis]|uniref:Uncharacterized protein n=1 Tax=Zootermopsis nevadensis TaxID=136037 RepID=A0A067QSC9_ZOONE|nr:hypothetical protein L798_13524 [Zootermopsis nevadensis]